MRYFHVFGILAVAMIGLQITLTSFGVSSIPSFNTPRWWVMAGTVLWALSSHTITVFLYFERQLDQERLR
jgi:hypothetical protein